MKMKVHLDVGARCFFDFSLLTARQLEIAFFILESVAALARNKYASETRAGARDSLTELSYQQPHNVFAINGRRGSGKTSILITLHWVLTNLDVWRLGEAGSKGQGVATELQEYLGRKGDLLSGPHLVLRVLNPNDMEHAEDVMEGVFAQLLTALRYLSSQEIARGSSDKVVLGLIKRLQDEVMLGWTFSRKIGLETLSRDSLSYEDFNAQLSGQLEVSHNRQGRWREFVVDLLDQIGRQLLIIFIDDSDLAPETSASILAALRIYLSHPRILIVLAVDLEQLARNLELLRDQEFAQVLRALPAPAFDALRFRQAQTIDEYLYKLLPPAQRKTLALERADLDRLYISTFEGAPRGSLPLDALAAKPEVELFLATLKRKAFPGLDHGGASWRLFYGRMDDLLLPLSLREVNYFLHELAASDERSIGLGDLLDSVVRTGPSFFRISRYLGEKRLSAPKDLLRQRDLEIIWTPSVALVGLEGAGVEAAKREPYRSSAYIFRLIVFLIDLELVEARLDRSLDWLLNGRLLPALPSIGLEPVAIPLNPGKKLGIAAYREESALPRNCIYFEDLVALGEARVLPFESNTPSQEGWASAFLESKKAGRSLAAALGNLERSAPNASELFARVVNDHHGSRRIQPLVMPAYRLPALWLLMALIQREDPLGESEVVDSLKLFGRRRSTKSKDEELESQEAKFADFLSSLEQALSQRQAMASACRQVLRGAICIATAGKETETPDCGELTRELETKLSRQPRAAILLAWSIGGVLQAWLQNGLPGTERKSFEKLNEQLVAAATKLEELRKDDPFEMIDIPAEALDTIAEELAMASSWLAAQLALGEQGIAPERGADPLTLDRRGQIAFILRVSPQSAESLLEQLGW